jgi:hypothetical protein
MAGGFKRSGVFGILGVFVVAAIAMSTGESQSNPKTTHALMAVVLFLLQRLDLERAAGGNAKDAPAAVAKTLRAVPGSTRDLWLAERLAATC